MRNIVTCLSAARRQGADYVEVREEAQRAEFEQILRRKAPSIWSAGSCGTSNSYYVDRHGDTPTFRPWSHPEDWWAASRPDLSPFEICRHVDRVPERVAA